MDIYFEQYDINKHSNIVSRWDEELKTDPSYESIRHFILGDRLFYSIGELLWVYHDNRMYGKDEVNKSFIVFDKTGQPLGFVVAGTSFHDYCLALRYIALDPKFQNRGIGKEVVKALIEQSKTLLGCEPISMFTRVHQDNIISSKMFEGLGCRASEVVDNEYFDFYHPDLSEILEKQ